MSFVKNTMNLIAKRLDVSASTVSRALAGKPGVSEKRRLEIKTLADELGYVPDPTAGALRSGVGSGLTVVVQYKPTEVTMMRVRALCDAAQVGFGSVRVMNQMKNESSEDSLKRAIGWNPRAIVVCGNGVVPGAVREALFSQSIALVALDGVIEGYDSVEIDRKAGMKQAVRLLLHSGRKFPVFFANATLENPDERISAILEVYEEMGMEFDAPQLISLNKGVNNDYERGYVMGRNVLRSSAADAVFCYNDTIAIGLMKALHEAGAEVPKEIAVIGFDDLALTDYLPIALTTVNQPIEGPVLSALDFCHKRIADPASAVEQKTFSTSLIARDSAPIPSNEIRVKIFS